MTVRLGWSLLGAEAVGGHDCLCTIYLAVADGLCRAVTRLEVGVEPRKGSLTSVPRRNMDIV